MAGKIGGQLWGGWGWLRTVGSWWGGYGQLGQLRTHDDHYQYRRS